MISRKDGKCGVYEIVGYAFRRASSVNKTGINRQCVYNIAHSRDQRVVRKKHGKGKRKILQFSAQGVS